MLSCEDSLICELESIEEDKKKEENEEEEENMFAHFWVTFGTEKVAALFFLLTYEWYP